MKILGARAEGISAKDIAKECHVHRTTVHDWLNSLELMGKVRSEHGSWYAVEEREPRKRTPEIPALIQRIFEQTDEIRQILFKKKDSQEAFDRMQFLIAQLDKSMKEEMRVETHTILKSLNESLARMSRSEQFFLSEKTVSDHIYFAGTVRLLSKLYSLIYEKYDAKSMIGMKEGVKP